MSLSKSSNIFWKMIQDKKSNNPNSQIPQETKRKETISKPKKLSSVFLERIEKGNTNKSSKFNYAKRNSLKNQELILELEKKSTFNKIVELQILCKEMISAKERFEKNKNQIIEKINKNCHNYYKSKICMKEIYDFCQAKKPEEHIDYILVDEPEIYLEDKYDNIYNFLFMLRNNNKLMLKLINYCNEEKYEQLCDFLVNFCYEDTINSSFIQEELMLLIYLIFEKYFFGILPDNFKIDDNNVSYEIFRSQKNIIYHIVKSLTRKADIRNFLCSILVDDILKLEGNRKYLSPNIFNQKNLEEEYDYQETNINNNDFDSQIMVKKYSVNINIDSQFHPKLKKYRKSNLSRTITKIENIQNDLEKFDKNKEQIDNDKKENEKEIQENKKEIESAILENNDDEIYFDPLEILENASEFNIENVSLNSFFENNNIYSDFISKELKEYEHYSKTNSIYLAMIDYLKSLLKDIDENKNKGKNEIYSNSQLIKVLKINKLKEEKSSENNISSDKEIEMIINNYNLIEKAIDNILDKLNENITSVPFTIKCLSNIIEQLLNKKYTKKSNNILSHYQKYIFKSNFFFGNILLSSILNRDYNGIITSEVTSKITTENLKIIYDIFDKLLSGKLFRNDSNSSEYFFYTIFNKLIIWTMPKIFNIIDKIETKFKLPDIMQQLVDTCTDLNNSKRLNDFEYDYFFEKSNEVIQYQSLCFNLENLGLLSHLLNEVKKKDNYLNNIITNEKDKLLFEKICGYEHEFNRVFSINKNNNQKCEFFILTKLNYNINIEKKINLKAKDNFTDNFQNNINNFSKDTFKFIIFKKCLIEVLSYVNIIDKNSFLSFTRNKKSLIYDSQINKKIYKKIREKEFNEIIFDEKVENNNEEDFEFDIDFKDSLFQKIMDFLKYEIGSTFEEEEKSQRVIFCTSYIQYHMEDIPKEYMNNNYSKLFMELTKETLTILKYLNNNILNLLYNKIKEGNKLNMIIASNCLQIKSMEKYKCIEYLYSKLLIPNKFKITKDEKDNITKIEYIRDKPVKKVQPQSTQIETNNINENKNDNNDKIEKNETKEKQQENNNTNTKINEENNINNNIIAGAENNNIKSEINNPPPQAPPPPPPKLELIKNLIEIIPNYKEIEKNTDEEILKIEEESGVAEALKNFFRTMKLLVKKEKVVKRFSKDDVDSIAIELENYVLFKLYDKLYPTKLSKDDIRFYNKCCRLDFIKPYNIITDKNIVNEKLWETSKEYLNDINNKFTPADKIKSISKAFAILQNSITFCSGKKELGVDDTIKPLIYVLMKTKPKNIFTNYNYCQLFLNGDLAKKEFGILLTQVYLVMRIIKDMKYNELIGVTEEQFGKDEDV